jgi:hypothetical protein
MAKTLALALSTLALAATAPSALAAERHAAPGGSGTDCTIATPCSIETAFSGAVADDEIILAPGDYGSPSNRLTTQLAASAPVTVHGPVGGPRPKIWSGIGGGAVVLQGMASRISYVDIDYAGDTFNPALWGNMSTLEHVRIESTGCGVFVQAYTGPHVSIANTAVHAMGEDCSGINFSVVSSVDVNVENSTLVAPGPGSNGIIAFTYGLTPAAVSPSIYVHNSIVRGSESDVHAQAERSQDSLTIELNHSSFETSTTYGDGTNTISAPSENGNQATAPVFVSLSDLRQAAGSPTIDAGDGDPTPGATDAWGDARLIGSAVDIGADEFTPPPSDGPGDDAPGSGSPGSDPGPGGDAYGTGSPGDGAGGTVPTVPAAPATPAVAKRCVVPRLTGKTLAAAKKALRKAGCATGKVKTKRSRKFGKVVAQATRPGKRLTPGARIALTVGRR